MTPPAVLSVDEEHNLTRLLDLIADQVETLEDAATRAIRRGHDYEADGYADRAAEFRDAHAGVAKLAARFHVPYRVLPRRPGEPPG